MRNNALSIVVKENLPSDVYCISANSIMIMREWGISQGSMTSSALQVSKRKIDLRTGLDWIEYHSNYISEIENQLE